MTRERCCCSDEWATKSRVWCCGTSSLSTRPPAVPRAVTPADLALEPHPPAVSNDGRRFVVKPVNTPAREFRLDGSTSRPVAGAEPGDVPLRYAADGRHLFVRTASTVPAIIIKVDLETGRRTPWRELAPDDPTGVFSVDRIVMSSDGAVYAYSNRRVVSRLLLLEGLEGGSED